MAGVKPDLLVYLHKTFQALGGNERQTHMLEYVEDMTPSTRHVRLNPNHGCLEYLHGKKT